MSQYSVSFVPSYCTFWLYIVSCYSDGELLLTRIHMSFSLLHLFIRENEFEDTTAAVLMVDKYGGKDTPGNMAVNTRLPTHAL